MEYEEMSSEDLIIELEKRDRYIKELKSEIWLYKNILANNEKNMSAFIKALEDNNIRVGCLHKELGYAEEWDKPSEVQKKESIGKIDDEILKENIGFKLMNFKKQVLKKGFVKQKQLSLEVNGKERIYNFSGYTEKDEAGNIKGITTVSVDITEAIKKEEEILENHNVLSAILESSADGIFVENSEQKVVHYNNKFLHMWQLASSDMEIQNAKELAHIIKERTTNPSKFMEVISELVRMENKNIDNVHLKDGRIIEMHCTPLIMDGKNNGLLWNFRDVTENKMLQIELINKTMLVEKLIELMPDGILLHKNGKAILANEAAKKMLKTEITGTNIGELFTLDPVSKKEANRRISLLSSAETKVDFIEYNITLENGENLDVELGAFSFKEEDGHYVTTIIRSLQEKQKISNLERELLEKEILLKKTNEYNVLKTQLFSIVSHELKTPLNIILGVVQLLQKYCTDSRERVDASLVSKYLAPMKQNCYRLLRLINNLLDMNKIEGGYFKADFENVNIISLLEDITLSVAQHTENIGINLIFDTNVEEKIMACDGEKIERIMLNLLSNAMKFTEKGGSIEVNVCDEGDNVSISVKDTGTGIPESMHEKIFESFTQVDSTLRRKVEGTGLGLSLVKSLVKIHNGDIKLKSGLNKGSEFVINLPVKLVDNNQVIIREKATSLNNPKLSNDRIERVMLEFSDIYS